MEKERVEEKCSRLSAEVAKQFQELNKEFTRREFYILFSGKHDAKNAIVSFHAGSGGTEAQDWTEMLIRMILKLKQQDKYLLLLLQGQEEL